MRRRILMYGLIGLTFAATQTVRAESDGAAAAQSGSSETADPFGGPSLAAQPDANAGAQQVPQPVPISPPPAPGVFQGTETTPPDAAAPAAPAPAETPGTPREQAIAKIVEAQEMINQGQIDAAVAAAGEAIALDPENAAAYRKVRAKAYAMQGQYEQALADVTPLELTVGVPQARLMSGRDVVAVVPGGTQLFATEMRGVWILVSLPSDQKPITGWIHVNALARGPQPETVMFGPPDPIGPGWEFYGEGYYQRPYHDYGRRYYDYWRHVPPRYWRYLP